MASIISLIGAPGSGKGTYGHLLASRLLNSCFISVGDILREQASTNKQLASVMQSGSLVDDTLVNDAVVQSLEDRLAGKKGIVILDGYPRNSEQASLLSKWPTRLLPSFAIQFDVPDHVCITKILGRRKCTICNKSLNVNGVNTDGFNMPPMLPKEGDCKVQCSPKDWQKRDDDTEQTIKLRFEVYHNETKPVLQYWKEREQLVRFVPYNGVQDIDKLVKVVEPQLKGISKE